MHIVNGLEPFTSAVDGIGHFTETATALGIRLADSDKLELVAPCGVEDVLEMIVRPTVYYSVTPELRLIYSNRMKSKNWPSIWPKVKVFPINEVIQ